MSWLSWALSTATLFASFNLLARKFLVENDDAKMFAIVFNILAALMSLLLFLVNTPASKPLTVPVVLLTLCSGLLYATAVRTQFYAIKHTEASLIVIIYRLSTIITVVTAFLFLHEPITIPKLLGIGLIVFGNVMIVYKNTQLRANKGFLFAIISAVTSGIALTLDKFNSSSYTPAFYTMLMYLLPGVFIALTPVVSLRKIAGAISTAGWKTWVLAALSIAGYYSLLKAFALADATKVVPVAATSTILTVLAGTVILQEKTHTIRKIVAAAIVVSGIYLLR